MSKISVPMHPGRILLTRAMEPLGISRNQLARDIDVPVGRISDITNAKRGITADTALRFGRYFGTGAEMWLRLQAEYDLYVARQATWPEIEERVRVLADDQLAGQLPGAMTNPSLSGPPPAPAAPVELRDSAAPAASSATSPNTRPASAKVARDPVPAEPVSKPDSGVISVTATGDAAVTQPPGGKEPAEETANHGVSAEKTDWHSVEISDEEDLGIPPAPAG